MGKRGEEWGGMGKVGRSGNEWEGVGKSKEEWGKGDDLPVRWISLSATRTYSKKSRDRLWFTSASFMAS